LLNSVKGLFQVDFSTFIILIEKSEVLGGTFPHINGKMTEIVFIFVVNFTQPGPWSHSMTGIAEREEKEAIFYMKLEREFILNELFRIFNEKFEISNPGTDDDLREDHEFDSIDAIELLVEIERILGFSLSQEQKKMAMDVRTINQICDYIQKMESARV